MTEQATICNMPIEGVPDNILPLAAFVVIKSIDPEDGQVQYMARATKDLTTVECLGMAHYSVLALEAAASAPYPNDDEE